MSCMALVKSVEEEISCIPGEKYRQIREILIGRAAWIGIAKPSGCEVLRRLRSARLQVGHYSLIAGMSFIFVIRALVEVFFIYGIRTIRPPAAVTSGAPIILSSGQSASLAISSGLRAVIRFRGVFSLNRVT